MGPQIGIAVVLLTVAAMLAFAALKAFRTPRLANAISGTIACAFAVLFASVAIVGMVAGGSASA